MLGKVLDQNFWWMDKKTLEIDAFQNFPAGIDDYDKNILNSPSDLLN